VGTHPARFRSSTYSWRKDAHTKHTGRQCDLIRERQLYLKGLYHFDRFTPADLRMANDFFEKAALKDPGYAAAYAGLAETSAVRAYLGDAGAETLEKARSAANRAVQLDDSIPESHVALALADFIFWNFPGTDSETHKALTLDPNSAFAHQIACWLALAMGRNRDAIAECRRSVELDPLSLVYNDQLIAVNYMTRDYDGAIEQAHKTSEIDSAKGQLGAGCAMAGQRRAATGS
jgi:tetratricopeptide (TPR) repeat protein